MLLFRRIGATVWKQNRSDFPLLFPLVCTPTMIAGSLSRLMKKTNGENENPATCAHVRRPAGRPPHTPEKIRSRPLIRFLLFRHAAIPGRKNSSAGVNPRPRWGRNSAAPTRPRVDEGAGPGCSGGRWEGGRKAFSIEGEEVLIIERRLRLISAALLFFSRPPSLHPSRTDRLSLFFSLSLSAS